MVRQGGGKECYGFHFFSSFFPNVFIQSGSLTQCAGLLNCYRRTCRILPWHLVLRRKIRIPSIALCSFQIGKWDLFCVYGTENI